MNRAQFFRPVALMIASLLGACSSGGGGDSATGSLSVLLMDAPVEHVTALHVQISGLRAKPAGDGPAIDLPLPEPTVTVDLLAHGEENAAVLVDGVAVPAGAYNWLEMQVNAEHDGIMDSYVMTDIGEQMDLELRVPSGRVRLVSGFEVGANQAVRFVFDWDVRRGLVKPPGLNGYLLKPAFRALRADAYGVLSGTIDALLLGDASCASDDENGMIMGNVVYVYAGHGVVPFDIDGNDPEPVVTAKVEQDMAGDYVYRVPLAPGDYTVAFSCEAGNDEPESSEDIVFQMPTDISIDVDGLTLDFTPDPV